MLNFLFSQSQWYCYGPKPNHNKVLHKLREEKGKETVFIFSKLKLFSFFSWVKGKVYRYTLLPHSSSYYKKTYYYTTTTTPPPTTVLQLANIVTFTGCLGVNTYTYLRHLLRISVSCLQKALLLVLLLFFQSFSGAANTIIKRRKERRRVF